MLLTVAWMCLPKCWELECPRVGGRILRWHGSALLSGWVNAATGGGLVPDERICLVPFSSFSPPFLLTFHLTRSGSLYLRIPDLQDSKKYTYNWASLRSVLATPNRRRHNYPMCSELSLLPPPPPHTCLHLTLHVSSVCKPDTVCTLFLLLDARGNRHSGPPFFFPFLLISLLKVVNRCPVLEATVGK